MQVTRKRPTVPRLRGLPASRGGALLLAAACAVTAAGVIVYAISQYRKSVNTSSRQATVLVATTTIQRGTTGAVIGSRQLVRPTPVLQKNLPVGAVTDAAQLSGRVALHDILSGQQLKLSDFGTSTGYVSELAPDERAISVALDTSHGLASVVQAGEHVDVYAGLNVNASGSASSSGAGGANVSASGSVSSSMRLLLTDVPVIAVNVNGGGSGVSGGSGNVSSQADVLLKVKAADAGAVAFASDNEKIWLVLRGANAVTPKSENGVVFNFNELLHRPVASGTTGGTP